MKLKEKWNVLPVWQKVLILIRDLALYAVFRAAVYAGGF